MELDNEQLGMIGLAFICGYTARKAMDEPDEEECETEEDKPEIKSVEVKKITPEEMSNILDDLKNKIMGGKE